MRKIFITLSFLVTFIICLFLIPTAKASSIYPLDYIE